MTLTPEQKQAVAAWVAAGDNLSAVQKKLVDQFKLSLTYRDVRFLVDDLNLDLKDAAPKIDASDVTKVPTAKPVPQPRPAAPEKKGFFEQAGAQPGTGAGAAENDTLPPDEGLEEDFGDALPADGGGTGVSVSVDKVTLIPGAVASGTVTFSDGVTGKWLVDQYGRPGFTEVSQPGYRPTPADAQSFMQELSRALQQRGF